MSNKQRNKIGAEEIANDLQDIERRWEIALGLKEPDYVSSPRYHIEYFPIFNMAGERLWDKGLIVNWRAHLAGLRHKTANAILITEDRCIVAQQRAHDDILFPSRYTVSAGGHLGKDSCEDNSEIDTLETLRGETGDELGLKDIDRDRFIPLGDPDIGLPNLLYVWEYETQGKEATITVFDKEAENIGIDVRAGSLSSYEVSLLKKLVRKEMKGEETESELLEKGIKLYTRNIELCHFYTAKISKHEKDKIHFADDEVAGYKLVSFDDLIEAGNDLDTATDSLYILSSDKEVAKELKKRVTAK